MKVRSMMDSYDANDAANDAAYLRDDSPPMPQWQRVICWLGDRTMPQWIVAGALGGAAAALWRLA